MYNLNFQEALNYLNKKEQEHDKLVQLSRTLIKKSSNIIKLLHSNNFSAAQKELYLLSKKIKLLKKFSLEWKYLIIPIEQEYAEAALLYYCLKNKPIPSQKKLKVSVEGYVLGLLDLFGELRREVVLSLSKNDLNNANRLFLLMSKLFDELLVFRFSNTVLPNFKKKLDVARIQLEQARIELLHATQVKK
ncbi:MAG: hypothetical protein N3D10_02020 [Candidatus Micrarchaeota archaeon]|nr:hypothetical protein [Candidatus Micrarchaeota archaeon]